MPSTVGLASLSYRKGVKHGKINNSEYRVGSLSIEPDSLDE